MSEHEDLLAAVTGRQRGRSRVRIVTVAVGAAGLAAAGVVAYTLPAPAHTPAATVTPASGPTSAQYTSGDDGGEYAGTAGGSQPAHATSGGS